MGLSEMETNQKINPQVVEIEIGVRSLRKIKVYPLSVGDQLKITEVISQGISGFFVIEEEQGDENKKMMRFASFLLGLVQDNIAAILKYVTDEDEKIMQEITNLQLIQIADIVYSVNFEGAIKNAMSLFKRARGTFQLERPSQPFVSVTEDTGSSIFTAEDLMREESASDK